MKRIYALIRGTTMYNDSAPVSALSMRAQHGIVFLVASLTALMIGTALAAPVGDLNALPTPAPDAAKLSLYVKGVVASGHPVPNVTPTRQTIYPYKLIALGKAFFWDMQVGSDGIVACASCHFKSGIDDRERNTLLPGPDGLFQAGLGDGRNVSRASFPFHKMVNAMSRGAGGEVEADPAVVHDFDDVIGPQGVVQSDFLYVRPGRGEDAGRLKRDSAQALNGRNIRQVSGRQAPSIINAVFNMMNFWDGRAHMAFNGVDGFGPLTPDARIHEFNGLNIVPFNMLDPAHLLTNASLASQALVPPLSEKEMSWKGRSWPQLGRKLLTLRPLAGQRVHPDDSIFGFLGLVHPTGRGLDTTYGELIREVFQERFWNAPADSTILIDGEPFTLVEANASLFWGLALMAYESTLVSDDSPVDRHQRGDPSVLINFSSQLAAATGLSGLDALRGKGLFESDALACADCHGGAATTVATAANLLLPEEALVELMPTHATPDDGVLRFYDVGFYNIGVRPTGDDPGRGGTAPNGIPLAFSRHRDLTRPGLPPDFDPSLGGTFDLTPICQAAAAVAANTICPADAALHPILEGSEALFGADGNLAVSAAFKTPHLRNIELTGPYFHTGGMSTLMQVVEFYARGGDFHEKNEAFIPLDLPETIDPLNDGGDGSKLVERQNLVAFLLALTDERVRQEAAPFDHPQLFYAEGHDNALGGHPKITRTFKDHLVEVPAIGRSGRSVAGQPALAPSFSTSADRMFHFRPTQ